MADTPRVTVPVEPTEAMIEAAESAGMTMAGSDMSSPDTTRHIWSAMLSAAPAPEGGAVSEGELRDAITLILPMAKGYAAANPVGSNQAYVDYVENLIATREEAQPVAWSLDFGMGVNAQTTFSTEGKAEHYAKDCPKPSPSVVPLYTTPPAPEAEKLRALLTEIRDTVQITRARHLAAEALAALQQEGR